MGPIFVAVSSTGLSQGMAEIVARLAGTGEQQQVTVTVVHVAKVWGTSLGLQHPALQPNAHERTTAQEVAARAALDLRERGVEAAALVVSGRDTGKAIAAAAQRASASTIVVGRGKAGRLSRLLRDPDPARVLLGRAACTLVVTSD